MVAPATTPAKNTICLWFDSDTAEAALSYTSVFPESKITVVPRPPNQVYTDPDPKLAKRVFEVMTTMGKSTSQP